MAKKNQPEKKVTKEDEEQKVNDGKRETKNDRIKRQKFGLFVFRGGTAFSSSSIHSRFASFHAMLNTLK